MKVSRRALIAGGLSIGLGIAVSRLDGAPPARPTVTAYRDPT